MSLSMGKESQGKWEYVPSRKEKEQGKKSKKSEMIVQEKTEGLINADPTKTAFAALDKWEKAQEASGSDSDDSAENSRQSTGGVFSALEEENLRVDRNGKPSKAAPKAEKKPKVKKIKVQAKDVAAALKASDVAAEIKRLDDVYKSAESDSSKCEMLADYLWKTFSEADLPFNKMLMENELSKVQDVPLQYLPEDVTAVLSEAISKRQPEALEKLAGSLISAVFEGMPDFKTSKQSSLQPPKAKVGLLVMLSILLRQQPGVLVGLCPTLLSKGSALTAPLRLPQTLWTLNQAVASGPDGVTVAIHVWCSVILPQMLGTSLLAVRGGACKYSMMQRDAACTAMAWLEGVLSNESQLDCVGDGIEFPPGCTTPAIPLGAVETLARSLYGGELEDGEPSASPKGLPSKATRDALAPLLPKLRTMAFQVSATGGHPAEDALVLALETAEGSAGPYDGAGSRLVHEATCSVLCALAASDAAFAKWEEKHKKMIKGSSRVLQHLATAQPELLDQLLSISRSKAQAFCNTMLALRKRHQLYLESGKGWQGASASASDSATAMLSGVGGKAVRQSSKTSFLSRVLRLALVSGITATVVYAIAEPKEFSAFASRYIPAVYVDQLMAHIPPEISEQTRLGLSTAWSTCKGVASNVVAAIPQEAKDKVAPLMEKALHVARSASSQATELYSELVKQWST